MGRAESLIDRDSFKWFLQCILATPHLRRWQHCFSCNPGRSIRWVGLSSFASNASQAATFVSCCLWSYIAMFFPTYEVYWSLGSFFSCRGQNGALLAGQKEKQIFGSLPNGLDLDHLHRCLNTSAVLFNTAPSTPRSSSFCYSGGAFLFSQPSSQQNLKNDAFCSSFWCWFQKTNKLMLYFAGHDCVHHWPFDVQEVRTCKGGALLRFFESEENMSDSTPKCRQSPQTVAEGKHRSNQSESPCNILQYVTLLGLASWALFQRYFTLASEFLSSEWARNGFWYGL